MFGKWRSMAAQQKSLLRKVKNPVAVRYLETPLPEKNTPLEKIQFLALDFETTGLQARSDFILSMGYTRLTDTRLFMRDSQYQLICVDAELPATSVALHQITDDHMQKGIPLHAALDGLVTQLCGRVLLVHYAKLERSFLQAAMRRVYGFELPFLLVDTMQLERRQLDRLQRPVTDNQLRLANLRDQYRLPRYGAHNALEDAVATAELFFAQLGPLCQQNPTLTLGDILC